MFEDVQDFMHRGAPPATHFTGRLPPQRSCVFRLGFGLVATAANLAPDALRAHRVVFAHLGLDLGRPEHARTIGAEHPLLVATAVVDQAPPLVALDDLADAFDAQAAMLDRNA